jgi:hypothetical protein
MATSRRATFGEGTARSRPFVYGCIGFPNTSVADPVSITRPAYMTAMRCASPLTTATS